MRFLSALLPALAVSLLLGGGDCMAMGSVDKSSLPPPAKETPKETLQRAKQSAENELYQWKNRLTQVNLAQCGNAQARRYLTYGKPGEDPTSAMMFASAPSDYEADVLECQQHIKMLKKYIAYYDKELAKAEKEEEAQTASSEGGGGH